MRVESISSALLYHGTNISGLKTLTKSEESTIGEGIYLTSEKTDAMNYAVRRAKNRGGNPVVYSVMLNNAKLLNMTDVKTFEEVMSGFEKILLESKTGFTKWFQHAAIDNSITLIREGVTNLKAIVNPHQRLFTEYIVSLGYSGIIAIGGGEGDFGEHDSWVIFKPSKINILHEVKM